MNPETWAVSKSDIFIKDPSGRDADKIAFGSTLSIEKDILEMLEGMSVEPAR